MKSIVLLFVIPLIGLSLSARDADAQRSGTLQATARVVNTRQSLSGLESAHAVASQLARGEQPPATVETSFAQVAVRIAPRSIADRPRPASITINYLRN